MLRHILQVYLNAGGVHDDPDKGNPGTQDDVATPLYLPVALLNHSCDPNVMIMCEFGLRGISQNFVQASRPIFAGQEVFSSYGPHYAKMASFVEREEFTLEEHFFRCTCRRCILEKENTPDGFDTYFPIACSKCDELMSAPTGMGYFFCSGCKNTKKLDEVRACYVAIQATLKEADEMMGWLDNRLTALSRGTLSGGSFAIQAIKEKIERFDALIHITLATNQLHRKSSCHILLLLYRLCEFQVRFQKFDEAFKTAEESLEVAESLGGNDSLLVYECFCNMARFIIMPILVPSARFTDNKENLVQRAKQMQKRFEQMRAKLFPLKFFPSIDQQ